MQDLIPQGHRQITIEIISLVAIIVVVYGYLIITRPPDASTVILTALGAISGNRAVGSWNSSVQHKVKDK